MNTKFNLYAALGLALLCPLTVPAQATPSTGAAQRIAVINLQGAIANCAEGKQAFTELQQKYAPRRQDLQQQQQAISQLQDQLQRQSATLSDDERLRLTRDLDDKQRLFTRAQEDAKADFQADSQEIVQRIGKKMVQIIDQYSQQNSIDLVIDDAQLPLYYVAKGADITQEIVKRYDTANPVAASPASSAAKPAAKPAGAAAKPAAATPHR
jgi:outer membrane protein